MVLLLSLSLGWAGTLEEENEALREAIESFQKEAKSLREENSRLKSALEKKDEVISLKDEIIEGQKRITLVNKEVSEQYKKRALSAERHIEVVEKALEQERKSKNIGGVERVFWASSLVAVAGLGAYGTLKNSQGPIIVFEENSGDTNERVNRNNYSLPHMPGRTWSIPLVYQRW